MKSFADCAVQRDSVPLLIWQPYNPLRTEACVENGKVVRNAFTHVDRADSDYEVHIKKHSLKNIASGHFDDYIRLWAQQIAEWGRPMMIRLMHEMNTAARYIGQETCRTQSWAAISYDFSGNPINQPGDFIPAWRHIIDIFRKECAANVAWVWSPLSWPSAKYWGSPDANPLSMAELYPEDDYVDWIGIEHLNLKGDRWDECGSEIIQASYREATSLSKTKPLIIAEMGSREDPGNPDAKAEWIRNSLSPDRAQSIPNTYPRIKAVIYWNDRRDLRKLPYRVVTDICTSDKSLQAFRESVSSDIYTRPPWTNNQLLCQKVIVDGRCL